MVDAYVSVEDRAQSVIHGDMSYEGLGYVVLYVAACCTEGLEQLLYCVGAVLCDSCDSSL